MFGLRLKLILPIIILWCCLFSIFNFYWLPNFLNNELQEYTSLQEQQLHLLSDSITDSVSRNDLANIYATLDHILEEAPSWKYMVLWDKDDRLLYPLELPENYADKQFTNVVAINNYTGIDLFKLQAGINPELFLDHQNKLIAELRWIFLSILLIGIIGSLFLEERIVRLPVMRLAAAAKKISRHDYNAILPQAKEDEIGDLIKSFDLMRCNLKVYEEELRQTRDKALDSTRMKSNFLATISHELRTPLNAILGYCDLIRDDVNSTNGEINIADLNNIAYSGKHLLTIIEGILDLTKIESGKMAIENSDFSLSDLIYDIIDNLKPLINANQNDIRLKLSPKVGMITADKTKIKQILLNLIGNAGKFTHDGLITVNTGVTENKEQACFYIEVIDSGIGIADDKQAALFEAFSQVDNSYNRKYEGIGLGLSLCKELCLVMQGSISVESKLNEGTKFTVRLPYQRADVDETAALSQSEIA